jgi:hypothetical protein
LEKLATEDWHMKDRSSDEVHVLDTALDHGYRAMAADAERETQAHEWCNALAKDMNNESR